MPPDAPLILGWEEWVALPGLALPAIKAKVDTGARTSALHAVFIEPFGPARSRKVRFGVHPIPRRSDLEVTCIAPLVGMREVRSSNGEREERYVIETTIRIGAREWPIEITLTNRQMMSYRMLIGRQALGRDILVDPGASFRQPKLGYKLYPQVGVKRAR
ncbi:MAG: ATP-dependent zinc protease [Hyphomicrobiaceae bacterium]|nr:ATP-dependent zinc protease [Hyphomicrobiaceae bacterium]